MFVQWWCHLVCNNAEGKKSLIMARKLACPVRFPIGTVLQPSKLSWGRERQSIGGEHYGIEISSSSETRCELWFPNYTFWHYIMLKAKNILSNNTVWSAEHDGQIYRFDFYLSCNLVFQKEEFFYWLNIKYLIR